jgi:uncharacterized protein YlxW (UPF0749 family)
MVPSQIEPLGNWSDSTALRSEAQRLGTENERLRAENERLRAETRRLRATLDAYITRAASIPMWGSHEMTAGTCVGPHPEPKRARR